MPCINFHRSVLQAILCLILFVGAPASACPYKQLSDLPHLTRIAGVHKRYRNTDTLEGVISRKDPSTPADVKIIQDPRDGLLAKVAAIREAQHTVDINTFIFSRSNSAEIILAELKAALERGVNVRILVDSLGSLGNFTKKDLKALHQAKRGYQKDKSGTTTDVPATLEIRVFNPVFHPTAHLKNQWLRVTNLFKRRLNRVPLNDIWHNRRMHDKILVADADYPDRATLIIGGRNISDDYYGVPEIVPETYNDMEVLARSTSLPSADHHLGKAVAAHYDKLFYHKGNKVLGPSSPEASRKLLAKMVSNAQSLTSPDQPLGARLSKMKKEDFLHTDMENVDLDFVHELGNLKRRNAFRNPESDRNRKNGSSLNDAVTKIVSEATNSIDIVSPYVVLYREELETLRDWLLADPNRRIRVVTNSLMSSDGALTQAVTDRHLGPMVQDVFSDPRVKDRFTLYSLGKLDGTDVGGTAHYGKLHAKYVVVDAETAFVGSANGDPRSRWLSSESGLIINGPTTGANLQKEVDQLVKGSYEWGSQDWEALRSHPNLRTKRWVQRILYPIIWALRAHPVL